MYTCAGGLVVNGALSFMKKAGQAVAVELTGCGNMNFTLYNSANLLTGARTPNRHAVGGHTNSALFAPQKIGFERTSANA